MPSDNSFNLIYQGRGCESADGSQDHF